MNVRWSPTDRWVTSVGGYDRCVFQFTFGRIAPPPPPPVVKTVWSTLDDSGKYMGLRTIEVPAGEAEDGDEVGVGHLPPVAEADDDDDDDDDGVTLDDDDDDIF